MADVRPPGRLESGVITVLHLITGLDRGGAEATLVRVVRGLAGEFRSVVVSVKPAGAMRAEVVQAGAELHDLRVTSLRDLPRAWRELRGILRDARPRVMQTWLYHADLFGTLVALSKGSPRLIWNVRNSGLGPANRLSWTLLTRTLAMLSGQPDAVVANSHAGVEDHRAVGYRPSEWTVVHNGFDAEAFRPRPEMKAPLRTELGLPAEKFLIALPARHDRFKDHPSFFKAIAQNRSRLGDAFFVLMGRGIASDNKTLALAIAEAGVADRLVLLGERDDMARILPAFDLVTLSSSCGEGIPNALGEAMACGLPVVATQVGGVEELVGDGGLIVPPSEPDRLADGWLSVMAMTPAARDALGARGRERIRSSFSIGKEIALFGDLYRRIADRT